MFVNIFQSRVVLSYKSVSKQIKLIFLNNSTPHRIMGYTKKISSSKYGEPPEKYCMAIHIISVYVHIVVKLDYVMLNLTNIIHIILSLFTAESVTANNRAQVEKDNIFFIKWVLGKSRKEDKMKKGIKNKTNMLYCFNLQTIQEKIEKKKKKIKNKANLLYCANVRKIQENVGKIEGNLHIIKNICGSKGSKSNLKYGGYFNVCYYTAEIKKPSKMYESITKCIPGAKIGHS